MRYLVVRQSDGLVVNAVIWDGVQQYEEPGYYLVPMENAPQGAWAGWTFTGDEWIAPVMEETPNAEN